MDNKKNNKGFSLIEMLVCLAISGIVILSAFSFILVGMDNYKKTSKTTSLQQEVSFTDNTFGEAIRDSSQADVYIVYYDTTDDIELHTGKKVLFYDKDKDSIYIYKETAFDPSNPSKSDNLVTKYVKNLNIKFVSDNVDTGLEAANTTIDSNNNKTVKAYSGLVKVEAEFEYKSKSSVSEVTYQIRNK